MKSDTGHEEGNWERRNFGLHNTKLPGLPPAKNSKCTGEKAN